MANCPICEREFSVNAPETMMPFCSSRCKKVDAFRWLSESYSFPIEKEEEPEEFFEPNESLRSN
ncbi:MAG: DNA gyrase inhibitor YacG [Thermoguttaceae bacterium]